MCVLSLVLGMSAMAARWHGTIDGVESWVTVVPRGHTISDTAIASQPWWAWGNATTDAYIFAFGTKTNARLILDFSDLSSTPRARIFVNNFSNAPLTYVLQGSNLTVTSDGGHPYLTVIPQDGAWRIGGKTNYNLTLLGDYNTCGGNHPPDGTVDWHIRVGSKTPGVADWETYRRVFDAHPGWGCNRFDANVRLPDAPPFKAALGVMPTFPYLGIKQRADISSWFVANPSPLMFDLTNDRLVLNSFPGFQIGGIYSITSVNLPPLVNFESPFVFYNFDPSTRNAQLVVRGGGARAGDAGPGPTDQQRNEIRYSWTMSTSQRWRYDLNIDGARPYTGSTTIGGTKLSIETANDYPNWVVGQSWPLVTFVEAVDGYPGSEGIYFYAPDKQSAWNWLSGASEHPPSTLEQPILQPNQSLIFVNGASLPPHFRGEYNAAYQRKPELYTSPVDNRLHLLGATGGVWNLGGGQVLRYHNLTGGEHIDGWTLESVPPQPDKTMPRAIPGTIEQSLYTLDGYLIYGGKGPGGKDQVIVRKSDYNAGSRTVAPPTSKSGWKAFVDEIGPFASTGRNPSDLLGWLSAFQGPTAKFFDTTLSDVRMNPSGFQMLLDVASGDNVIGNAPWLPTIGKPTPGRYLLRYDRASDAWSIEAASPPRITASLVQRGPIVRFEPSLLQVRLRNAGVADWTGDVDVLAGGRQLTTKPVLVPGRGSDTVEVTWSPVKAATSEIAVSLAGRTIDLGSVVVEHKRLPALSRFVGLPAQQPATLLAALAMAVFAIGLVVRAWR